MYLGGLGFGVDRWFAGFADLEGQASLRQTPAPGSAVIGSSRVVIHPGL